MPPTLTIPLADGLRIAVDDDGVGTPVVLLHGFTGSARAWSPQVLSALRLQHRVVALDFLGHGESEGPGYAPRMSMARTIADVGLVLDRLGIESASVVGYSMGGRVALGLACESPERVTCLVLESASPGLANEGDRRQRRKADRKLAERLREEEIEVFVDWWMALPLFQTQRESVTADRLDQERARRLQNDPHSLAYALEGLGTGAQPSYWDRLCELDCPTLLIAGAKDGKFLAVAEEMEREISRATLSVVPGAGHAIHLEEPTQWLDRVLGFLGWWRDQ